MHWADDFDNPPKSGRIIRQRLMKRLDEAPPDSGFRSAAFWPDYVRRKPAARLALGDCGGLGVDGWLCRHAGAQQACQAAIVERPIRSLLSVLYRRQLWFAPRLARMFPIRKR